MLENNERTFVVNHIKLVKNISEQSMRLMALGGFSNIYIAEIEFQPIGSHQQGKEDPV